MDNTARKIAGTYIPEKVHPPVHAYILESCRSGNLTPVIEKWIKEQKEHLELINLRIDAVEPNYLLCRIPAMIADSESPHPFRIDVSFKLDPVTKTIERIHSDI